MPGDRVEGLGKTPLDGLRELLAQTCELLEATFEILALRAEVVQPLLLSLVLLPCEWIDQTESPPTRFESRSSRRELVTIVALRRGDSIR